MRLESSTTYIDQNIEGDQINVYDPVIAQRGSHVTVKKGITPQTWRTLNIVSLAIQWVVYIWGILTLFGILIVFAGLVSGLIIPIILVAVLGYKSGKKVNDKTLKTLSLLSGFSPLIALVIVLILGAVLALIVGISQVPELFRNSQLLLMYIP